MAANDDPLRKLDELNRRALAGGGEERIRKQHELGKLTARERVDLLFDAGSFVELDRFVPGDGVVTGYGQIDARRAFVVAQDFTVLGGSLSRAGADKICKVLDLALSVGAPIINLLDSSGARIQEGLSALAGYADVFLRHALASGAIPQISAIMGPCAGAAVFGPAITDFVLMVEESSYMFITSPDVIKAVTNQDVTRESLGGASAHNTLSGAAHFACPSDEACIATIRELLSFLPSSHRDRAAHKPTEDAPSREAPELDKLIPSNVGKSYDIRALIVPTVDDGAFLEVHKSYATNMVCGFARYGGQAVGIVANQPAVLAGCLDGNAATKAARFVRFCDAFSLPLVTFVDVPGFLPSSEQEHDGLVVHGAKLLYAFAEATVPKVTVIARKAFGGAYDVMSSKHIRGDINYAFPAAEIAVMAPEAAVNLLHRKEIESADDKDSARKQLTREYREKIASSSTAAELGFVDAVIHPRATRKHVSSALDMLKDKRLENPPKKHGNMPL